MRTLAVLFALLFLAPAALAAGPAIPARTSTTCIIVHHSATPTGDVDAIRRYHVEHNHWLDIGYHYVILRDGRVQPGRAENLVGAHVRGRNAHSLGICLIGMDTFTPAQIAALDGLVKSLCTKYKIQASAKTIQRHSEACPGKGWAGWKE